MMREEMAAPEAPGVYAGMETDLWELERRYRCAKAALLDSEGGVVVKQTRDEFVEARAALRVVFEEIWPDLGKRCEH
ncbi:hypothetical protein CCAX7_006020 [Capsulimonas corticalis]|uniref:Uncharacterized protein n=1 Tax=Capsulimonas corticalis TaxID=2219043 RepID=A0A402D399_9BACT|nr:hypothetical protein [Capsulimonas corticalis]BDI28551.1 hypothetical protein CCAX7_006020 [Capsulimonas corticalis]